MFRTLSSWLLLTCLALELQFSEAGKRNEDILDIAATRPEENRNELRLWMTISARHRFIEISWRNAPARADDTILITKQQPYSFERLKLATGTPLAPFTATEEGSGSSPRRGLNAVDLTELPDSSDYPEGSGYMEAKSTTSPSPTILWISNKGTNDIVAAIQPTASQQWYTTGVPFDYGLSQNVTVNTTCYGFWASYVNVQGEIMASTCLRAYPRWMNEMRSVVGGMRMRDLLIPGTHDSGSYRINFDPLKKETIVTKYSLTQDDDIRGQLMHGARYLDIRIGYYRNTPDLFYINHGITRQRPLVEVIDQVKDFVEQTNEIIIFGIKEFPVGFGKKLDIHLLLVRFLRERFGDMVVHPSATWHASMRDIWSRKQNVILAYDKIEIVREFPDLLFGSVDQRWGNVRKWGRLESYLRRINIIDPSRLSSRPVADMAELTPDTWGVITDKYGGLRKMADNVNWRLSQLYRDELGENANIVAVDFMRGTTIMETAIDWNKRKVIY